MYEKERERILDELAKYSEKSSFVTILQTLIFGLHRLCNGKILSGILFAITINGFLIWWIVDLIMIVSGKFTDKYGKPINTPKVMGLRAELENLEKRHARGEL